MVNDIYTAGEGLGEGVGEGAWSTEGDGVRKAFRSFNVALLPLNLMPTQGGVWYIFHTAQ